MICAAFVTVTFNVGRCGGAGGGRRLTNVYSLPVFVW
jgi:hypothetical protein